jgi:peroxiredoxin
MRRDLTLAMRHGETFQVSTLRGKPLVIAFFSKAACHTGQTLELLDQIYLEIGPTRVHCIGCVVDLERDEPLREYYPFSVPIGAASRRSVADFLNASMSGFGLPQFLVVDREGRQRFVCTLPRGEEYWEFVDNLKQPIEAVVNEGEHATGAPDVVGAA